MFSAYEILEQRKISDLNSEGYILKHKKTGAYVTLLLNDDENKVFYIGFRTPPTDSTGVAHILEHSVLCGSKKFPIKDPFIELAKGSLNTFLNAMTYPDKTVYPVASCNDKDFHNLVDVYLDAVFNPNIYGEEKIFRQEGHHYELTDKDGELTINGVVYNEMKGVYSSPDDVVEHEVMSSLYPNITYGLESGGDPEVIPKLTYEEFLDFHGKYYHPSNSYIYLYGDLDAEEYLKFIDEEYLSKYDYLEVNSEVGFEEPFKEPKYIEKEYPVLDEESNEGTYLTYNICMGTSLDKELYIALDVLDYVLCASPGAIIKQALLDEGICDDVTSSVEGGIYQPYFSITARNSDKDKEDKFVRIIEDKLNEVYKNGLPKKALMAAVNVFEFKYRESDFGSYPRGLMLGLQALDSWLYDKNAPFLHIEANATYERLRRGIDEGYFEGLIKKYFLDNNHKSILSVSPAVGLTAKKDNELKERLAKYKASLSDDELSDIIKRTKELKEYQASPDDPEDLKKIPLLTRADLKKEAYKATNKECASDDTLILHHNIFTNGIAYLTLYFNINNIPDELLPYAGLLKSIWSLFDTDKHSYNDLFNDINIATGGMSPDYRTYLNEKAGDELKSFVYIKTKALYKKVPEALSLMGEIISSSKYDDYKRLNEVLSATKVRMQSYLISAAHQAASLRALGKVFKQFVIDDTVSGLAQYRFVSELTDNFEDKKEEIAKKLYEVSTLIFRAENLIVDITCDDEGFKGLPDYIREFKGALYTNDYVKKPFEISLVKDNEAYKTAGQVQYVCRAGNYKKQGLSYTGALKVLKVIMGYDYLWNNVRVLGGAYGCMSAFGRSGVCYFVSYRDPKLAETIDVFEKAADYIKKIKLSERQVTQYIIGALSDLDMPQTPPVKGITSFNSYMAGISDGDYQKERDELLSADEKTIRALSEYIKSFMEDEALCVVGNADMIAASEKLFDKIEQLT